jgi:hypothetical protein
VTLGDRTYMDVTPSRFFAHCYDLRSRFGNRSSDGTRFSRTGCRRDVAQPGWSRAKGPSATGLVDGKMWPDSGRILCGGCLAIAPRLVADEYL